MLLLRRSALISIDVSTARHNKSLEMDGRSGYASPTLCSAQITAQVRASTTNRSGRSLCLLSQERKTSTNFLPSLSYSVVLDRLLYLPGQRKQTRGARRDQRTISK